MGVHAMTLDLSHLTAATRELACNDAKARILSVQTARWVAYPRAGIAVEELERRFHYPTCARMPCMLALRRQRHGQIDDFRKDGTTAPE